MQSCCWKTLPLGSFNARRVKMLMFWLRAVAACARYSKMIELIFSERRLTSRQSARPLIWFVVRAIEDLLSAWWECVRYKVATGAGICACTHSARMNNCAIWVLTDGAEKRKTCSVQDWGHSPRMMNWTANCPLHSWAINTNVSSAHKKNMQTRHLLATFIFHEHLRREHIFRLKWEPVNCLWNFCWRWNSF